MASHASLSAVAAAWIALGTVALAWVHSPAVAGGAEGHVESPTSIEDGRGDAVARIAAKRHEGGDSVSPPASGRVADIETPQSEAVEVIGDPIVRAQRIIAECRDRFHREVDDYTCVFFKRERIGGRMTPQYAMQMKVRTRPNSIYIKILKPSARAGREAIYIEGRNDGKVLVHDVGWGKFLAGTLRMDPRGARAMEDCRHPITDAGLGHMLDTIAERWAIEMTAGETEVSIHHGVKVGERPCTLIVSTHPRRRPGDMFHSVRVYLDREHGVPVRFEAYDWPSRSGEAPALVEQYSFGSLRFNVGLSERDFDPSNEQYSFGRF